MSQVVILKPAINNSRLLTEAEVKIIGQDLMFYVKPRYYGGFNKGGNFRTVEDQIEKDLDRYFSLEVFHSTIQNNI